MTTAAPPSSPALISLPHSGVNVRAYYAMHFQGALFPLSAGVVFYGWRGAAEVCLVLLGAWAASTIWRRIGSRGQQLEYSHAMWLALVLSLMLPAHLASARIHGEYGVWTWPLPVAAGMILVMFQWVLGGLGAGRIHPVIVSYLLIAALSYNLLVPRYVLARNHMVAGDLLAGTASPNMAAVKEPWTARKASGGRNSDVAEAASEALTRYTSGREKPPRGWLSLQSLLRDSLPPLEDLVIGGQPGPLGASSAIAVIIGGLMLMYRGLIDYRIPLIIVLVEFAALLVLPIPASVSSHTIWHRLAFRRPDVGWAAGVTFANYEILASPALFMAFFLATAGPVRPMARRARTIYAILIGAMTAALQLYVNVAFGPYLALLMASLLTPAMDRLFSPRPLV
jgi:Na+-translocating ferredoxin:NAD+ oxidoreductase RnfD subunit